MTLTELVHDLRGGASISRPCFDDEMFGARVRHSVSLHDDVLEITTEWPDAYDGTFAPAITLSDILADDWFVVDGEF